MRFCKPVYKLAEFSVEVRLRYLAYGAPAAELQIYSCYCDVPAVTGLVEGRLGGGRRQHRYRDCFVGTLIFRSSLCC